MRTVKTRRGGGQKKKVSFEQKLLTTVKCIKSWVSALRGGEQLLWQQSRAQMYVMSAAFRMHCLNDAYE